MAWLTIGCLGLLIAGAVLALDFVWADVARSQNAGKPTNCTLADHPM